MEWKSTTPVKIDLSLLTVTAIAKAMLKTKVLLFSVIAVAAIAVVNWVQYQGSFSSTPMTQSSDCITLVADPNPPLNVRAKPMINSQNIVGQLYPGMRISVVRQQDDWFLLDAPISGWIYKNLTVTSCSSEARLWADGQNSTSSVDSGPGLLAIAAEQYQAGNLDAAIALAQAIQENSAVYHQARSDSLQWQKNWQLAQNEFYAAQFDLREGRWQAVLDRVPTFPKNRYWRERLTPLVRKAMAEQYSSKPEVNRSKTLISP